MKFFRNISEKYQHASLWLAAQSTSRRQLVLIALCVVIVAGVLIPTKHAEAVFWFPFVVAVAVLGGLGQADGILGDAFDWAGINILNAVLWIIQSLSAVLVRIAITFFDYAMAFTVGNNLLATPGAMLAIENGWKVVRDTANLFFIFALLAIAIATILRISGYGMKSLLPRLIIVALLINFSLPITRVVIDASNLVALQFHQNMLAASEATDVQGGRPSAGTTLLSRMGLKDAFGVGDLRDPFDNSVRDRGTVAVILVLQTILNFVTAWVFLIGGFLLLARLIAFVLLMVFSPAAFFFAILPKTKKYFDQWLTTLINQAVVAPLFLFLVALVLIIANSGLAEEAKKSLSNFSGGGFDVYAFFNWLLLVGLLYAAVKITRDLSGKFGATVAGVGMGATFGAAGFLGRGTLVFGASLL